MHEVVIRVESILHKLLQFKVIQNVQLSLSSAPYEFVIFKPSVIGIEMSLRNFRELRHGLEGLLLDSPESPVIVASGAHLMIIFWVEANFLYLLSRKVKLPKDFRFMEPIVGYCL